MNYTNLKDKAEKQIKGSKKKFSPLFAPYLLVIQSFLLEFVLNTNGNIFAIQTDAESIFFSTIIVVTITSKTYFSNKAEIIIQFHCQSRFHSISKPFTDSACFSL